MKSFQEYVENRVLSEEFPPMSTADPSAYRVDRPAPYNPHLDSASLFRQLQKPENLKMVMKVLEEHPELKAKLLSMIQDAREIEDFGGIRMR